MSSQNPNVTLATPLSTDERATLQCVLNLIIPPCEQRGLPGAAQYDVWAYVCERRAELITPIRADLQALCDAAQKSFGRAFSALGVDEASALAHSMRTANAGFLSALAERTVEFYYQQDAVLEVIGVGARPPFPGGYEVFEGDFSLLEPVRKRGRVYREV